MLFDLKYFSFSYAFLITFAIVISKYAQLDADAFWIGVGGFGFLVSILSLAFVLRVVIAGASSGSKGISMVIVLLKLPILILVSFGVAQQGQHAVKSFILGVMLFIPAFLISSLIRYVKSGTYRS